MKDSTHPSSDVLREYSRASLDFRTFIWWRSVDKVDFLPTLLVVQLGCHPISREGKRLDKTEIQHQNILGGIWFVVFSVTSFTFSIAMIGGELHAKIRMVG
jgi:hypothetical protein